MAEIGIDFTANAPTGSSRWDSIRGTVQEVLNKLSQLNIQAGKLVSYTDDGTNAEATFCRRR